MTDEERKSQQLNQLSATIADTLLPGLQLANVSFVLVLADENGWTYSLRGSLSLLRLAIENAAADIKASPDSEFGELHPLARV